uniref:Uncharacterized protein n=1 Tax=Amphimedon queenslandica TaxID=400682 RepID=A0A1X7SH26_AMPQE
MWGGYPSGVHETDESEKKKAIASLMEVYHLPSGIWQQRPTSGTPPPGVWGHSSIAIGRDIYYFGGACGGYYNSLYCFNVDSFNWRELSPSSSAHGPMMKAHCGMVAVHFHHEDYLAIIGGRTSSYAPKQPNARYEDAGFGSSTCNEIHYYSISSGQ